MVYLLAGVVVASLITPGLFASTISPRALPNPLIHSAEEPDQLRSLESGESSSAGPQIIEVDPETLECDVIVTFDDIPGDWSPGTNYDNILQFSGASFAERFMGQALTFNGNFDVLSGTPSSPLTLQIGAPNQNLDVFRGYFFEYLPPTQVLAGIGPLGYPNFSGVGEGAFCRAFRYGSGGGWLQPRRRRPGRDRHRELLPAERQCHRHHRPHQSLGSSLWFPAGGRHQRHRGHLDPQR